MPNFCRGYGNLNWFERGDPERNIDVAMLADGVAEYAPVRGHGFTRRTGALPGAPWIPLSQRI